VEVFVHGALCFCYSGQCLMSSLIGGRSGNRGLCAQPCRLPYSLGAAKGCLLSPKDFCALKLLPELISAGISALKIEGRMKSPEYVAIVTAVYRKYLDRCAEGGEYRMDEFDMRDLRLAFDRGGLTTGYLKGKQGSAFIARERPAVPGEARRTSVRALETRARESYTGIPRRKVCIRGRFTARAGEPLRFEAWDEQGNRASIESVSPAEEARNLPLNIESVRVQLNKTGGTPFRFVECAVETDGRASTRLSELNTLRRSVLASLEEKRVLKYPGRAAGEWKAESPGLPAQSMQAGLSVYLYRWREDLAGVLRLADRVYAPFRSFFDEQLRMSHQPGTRMAWLPAVSKEELDGYIGKHVGDLRCLGMDGVLIGNPGHIEQLRGCGLPLYGDASLNAFNGWALKTYAGLGLKGMTLSHELTMEQIVELPDCGIEKEAAIYGRLRLMTSAHCPMDAEGSGESSGRGSCGLCAENRRYEIVDRMGARFPLLCMPSDCYCDILNADTLSVPFLTARLAKAGVSVLRLYILDEEPGEVERLLLLFRSALEGGEFNERLSRGFTKGHYFRGV
jgi:U32 family peptidase